MLHQTERTRESPRSQDMSKLNETVIKDGEKAGIQEVIFYGMFKRLIAARFLRDLRGQFDNQLRLVAQNVRLGIDDRN